MSNSILGIHHITALAGNPQRNIDFYVGFLGLRMVKRTVNFDAPEVYHFYYGDEIGRPGTALTFFPFPNASKGKRGTGEVSAVAFSIPPSSLDYWIDRLAANAIAFDAPSTRFGREYIAFEDPDGMLIELVPSPGAELIPAWQGSAVEAKHATRGFHGVTITLAELAPTSELLTRTLGFKKSTVDGNRHRFLIGEEAHETRIDIVVPSNGGVARQSAGSVHHIAWRVPDDEVQKYWRSILSREGHYVTPVQDRNYFRSIYFREPGGVLFEIATDQPGFTVDESREELGSSLRLPAWLETRRGKLEGMLPPVVVPSPADAR